MLKKLQSINDNSRCIAFNEITIKRRHFNSLNFGFRVLNSRSFLNREMVQSGI